MHKKYYLAISVTLMQGSPALPATTTTTTVSDTNENVPWQPTFIGMGTQQQVALPPSGPFQAPVSVTIPQNPQPQDNDPFGMSANQISAQTTQTTAQSIVQLLTGGGMPLSQQINGMFSTNTTLGGQLLKVKPNTKHAIPLGARSAGQLNNVSFTQGQLTVLQPPALFTNSPQLLAAYTDFMNGLQNTPSFFPLFRKIHITALYQIFSYLTGIYASLNMTHIDDLKTYMVTEKQYALNQKTLIVNHLTNVIMAQLNQSIRSLSPQLPQSSAISSGMKSLQTDKVSNLNMFVLDIEKSVLTSLGLRQLDPSQTALAYVALKKYLPLIGTTITPDLQTGINLLNTVNFSVKNLTKAQGTTLANAMYAVLAYMGAEKTSTTLSSSIALINGTSTSSTPVSGQQFQQLAQLISLFSCGDYLVKEVAFTEKMQTLLGATNDNPSKSPLSSEEKQQLINGLGFILHMYEMAGSQQTAQIISVLQELNPTYAILSPQQSLQLQQVAVAMLATKKPLLLGNLSNDQRQLLAYGLWVTSNIIAGSSLTADQRTALQDLSTALKAGPVATATLSDVQKTVLQTSLTSFSQYTLSSDLFGQQAKALANAPYPGNAPGTPQQTCIEKAVAIMQSPTFKSFNDITQEEQILLLQLFQSMNTFFETRLLADAQDTSPIAYLFLTYPQFQKELLTGIDTAQYYTLVGIKDFLKNPPDINSIKDLNLRITALMNQSQKYPSLQGKSAADIQTELTSALTKPFSLYTLVEIKPYDIPEPNMDLVQALRLLYTATPPAQKTGPLKKKKMPGSSYHDILLSLQKLLVANKISNDLLITPATKAAPFQALIPQIGQENFSFNNVSTQTRNSLATLLSNYQEYLLKQDPPKYTRTQNLLDPTQSALETIADLIAYTQTFSSMKNSFLSVLNKYLVFFNLYTQTLQNVSQNSANPTYVGLTEFAEHAQSIRETLQYQSSEGNAIAQLLAQANPPLFFYDEATFRGIRLLPKLAHQVKNSSIVPYPTFGIEQASSATGTATDPLSGFTVSNINTMGSFSFNKFFFLQAPDATTEITQTLPSWITKKTVTSSKGTTIVYEPNNIPDDGITGFYMNIPIFSQNQSAKNSVTINLFEQPIIAQPAWLNNTGTDAGTPKDGIIPQDKAGVITLLRGCLGDFQALLDLSIFDPCLTIIFTSALNLSEDSAQKQTLSTLLQDKQGKCSAYIQEKQAQLKQQELITTVTVSQGTSLALPATGGAGS